MDKVTKDDLSRYVFEELSSEERVAFEAMVYEDAELREELDGFLATLEQMDFLGKESKDVPPVGMKQGFMDALEALEKEAESSEKPPIITAASVASDYAKWTDLPQHQAPESYDNLHYIPFAQNEDGASIIVWLDKGLPEETHHDSIEKFLVLQGSCVISFRGEEHRLQVGDTLSIPLHTPHTVTVTSEVACKMIVQRIAA